MSAQQRIALILARAVADLAADRGCDPVDLRAIESLRDAMLEAYRLGYEDGDADAHDRPTVPDAVIGSWDDETPLR
jgi:hypothetical protein